MEKPDHAKTKLTRTLLQCGCLLAPILLLLSLFVLPSIYNGFRLWRFSRNFAALSHPASSRFIQSKKAVGSFGQAHNRYDFLVAELRSGSGNHKGISNFYHSARVAVPYNADAGDWVKNGNQRVEIEFLPSPLPAKYRWNYSIGFDQSGWDLSDYVGRKDLYIVSVLNEEVAW